MPMLEWFLQLEKTESRYDINQLKLQIFVSHLFQLLYMSDDFKGKNKKQIKFKIVNCLVQNLKVNKLRQIFINSSHEFSKI